MNKIFQVFSEASVLDSLVSLAVVEGTIFGSGKGRIVSDWLRVFYQRLILDGMEDLVDWELQGVKCSFVLKA